MPGNWRGQTRYHREQDSNPNHYARWGDVAAFPTCRRRQRMRQLSKTPQTVDEYIARCAPEIQAKLHAVRIEARSNAPQAHEKIGYGIPTLTMGKNIFHFAAFKLSLIHI